MKSRQSHIPHSKRNKGALRFAEGKQISAVGQTSRQAKQFAYGIMGKYGFDRNNYLGMFALIFKSLELLKDKKLAASQQPSDRAWALQLQLQLQNLKHPESAPLITKQQTIRQLQQLVEQSGYHLPKEALFVQESLSQDQRAVSTQEVVSTDKPAKKRGRKSKKDKLLERNQLLVEHQTALQHADKKSNQEKLNDVNKGNSPIIVRSLKQLAASIGMLAHSTSSKTNQPNTKVNGAQHTGKPTNIQQKALHLLYKQALREESPLSSARSAQDQDKASRNPSHSSVAQHVDAIRNTSEWLEQFQAGKLSAVKSEDASVGIISSVKSAIQTQPSFLNVAKLILQEVTHSRMSQSGTSQSSSLGLDEPQIRRSTLMLQSEGNKTVVKLGEGPFSEKATPSTVRFIRSLLLKHAEQQESQGSKHSSTESNPSQEATPTIRSRASVSKGFLASSQQPMAINAASLTSRLPRSMHATAGSSTINRSVWSSDPSMNRVCRKQNGQAEDAERRQSLVEQQERDEARSGVQSEVRNDLRSESRNEISNEMRDEVRNEARNDAQLQISGLSKSQVNEIDSEQNQEKQVEQEQRELMSLQQQQVQARQHQQLQQQEKNQEQQVLAEMQDVQLSESAANLQVEQSLKRRRGRPRKNNPIVTASKELANKVIIGAVEQSTSQQQPRPVESNEKQLQGSSSVHQIEQEPVAAKRVAAVTPTSPAQVYRKPAAQGNGRTVDIIQSNESWFQQLVTIQRQPSSNETWVRSTNSVNSNVFQAANNQMTAPRSLTLIKPDLGTAVIARSLSERSDQRLQVASQTSPILSKFMNQNENQRVNRSHRSLGKSTVSRSPLEVQRDQKMMQASSQPVNRVEPFVKADAILRSATGNGRQGESARLQQRSQQESTRVSEELQQDQLKSEMPEGMVKRPSEELGIEIATRAAEASLRSTGTLFSRLEENVGSIRQGTAAQSLAAEIAAKVTQSSLAVMRPSRTIRSETGPLTLQRRLLKDSTPADSKNSTGVEQRGTAIEQTKASGTKSNVNNVLSSEMSASASMRESNNSDRVVKPIAETGASYRTNTSLQPGNGMSASHTSIDLVRRAGGPSRVDRVREQQASIQRKIDIGSTISRKPVLRLQSRSPILRSEEDGPITNRSGAWARGQLTLRVGQVENGTITRRTAVTVSEQQSRPASEVEQLQAKVSVQLQANTDEGPASPTGRTDVADLTQAIQPPSASVSNNEDQRLLGGSNAFATSRGEDRREGNKQQSQLVREIVQGSIVQRSANQEHRTKAKQIGGFDNRKELRKTGSIAAGRLIQRLSGIENGIQVRRANGQENVRPLGRMKEVDRVEFVQRSANLGNSGLVPGIINEAVNTPRQLDAQIAEPENGRFVQSSTSVQNNMLTQKAVAEEAARQHSLGQESGGVPGELGQQRGEASEGSETVRKSVDVVHGIPARQIDDIGQVSLSRRTNGVGQGSPTIRANGVEQEIQKNRTNDVERGHNIGQSLVTGSHLIQRLSSSVSENMIQRASETGSEGQITAKRKAVRWTEAQAEHIQRRDRLDGGERAPKRETNGSEIQLEAGRFRVDSAEQTIRAMVSAQVEERAEASDPAAASRAADVAKGARSASAPRARQNASMTPRVMPLLASSAGALRAPAGMAAASPAAAEHRLPAHGTGSLTLAAAAGRAAAPTAGVQRAASMTNSSSQGWAAAALTKPLPTQVQRQARSGATQSGADTHPSAPANSVMEHKQTSQLASEPLEMDWLRTKSSADEVPAPVAQVDQAPPELSEEQLKELIKQLPQLDIAKIADKVYREIEKKMKFERQRRGV